MEERRDQRSRQQQQQAGSRQQQQSQGSAQGSGQGSGRQPQQGGQQPPRQQQQFDAQGTRQPMGGGGDARLADQIRPHMDVIDDMGAHIGTVDHMEGDRIKLTRASSPGGEHHYLPLSLVAGIEGGKVRLRGRGDTSFGLEADR